MFQGVRAVICCTAVKVSPKEGDNANRDKYNQVGISLPATSLLRHLQLHVGCQHLYVYLRSFVAAVFISITDAMKTSSSFLSCMHVHITRPSQTAQQSMSGLSYTML